MSVATICQPGSLLINPSSLPTGAGVPYVENPMTNDLDANDYQLNNVGRVFVNPSDWSGITTQAKGQIVQDTDEGMVLVSQNQISLMSSDGIVKFGTGFVASTTTVFSDNTNITIASASGNITLQNGTANTIVNGSGIEIEANQVYAIGNSTAVAQDGNGNMVLENSNGVFQLTNKEKSGQIYDSAFFLPPNPFQCASATAEQNPTTYISYGTFTRITSAADANVVLLNEETQTNANLMVGIISDPSNTNGFVVVYNTSTGTANITFTASDAGKLVYLVRTGPDSMIRVSG